MTLDQSLLAGLFAATVAGVVIALLVHRTQVKWRRRDQLRDFIGTWAGQVALPTEVDAVRFEDKGLRLAVEQDARFRLAFKLVSKGLQREYKEFIRARSTYIAACHELYDEIKHECRDRTGLSVATWGNTKNWPEKVLLPNFVLSIYEQVLGSKRNTFRLEDISYDIGLFSYSGQGFERKGRHLTTTYDAYSGLELAQTSDEGIAILEEAIAMLEDIRATHRQMMEMDYCRKFTSQVEHIGYLRGQADTLAHNVREALHRLQVS